MSPEVKVELGRLTPCGVTYHESDGTLSALHNLPLVLFCRPSSWRNQLEQISVERNVSLNVVLKAAPSACKRASSLKVGSTPCWT
jgi:hypothetical protein